MERGRLVRANRSHQPPNTRTRRPRSNR